VNAGAIEVARFTTGGLVGIGTTAPSEKLHVAGNIVLGSTANGYQEAGSKYIGLSYPSLGTDGYVGFQFESVNAPAPYNGNYSQNIKFYTHHYAAGTGGTPRMTIQYDGNVGIGTTSPSQKLSVVGAVSASTYYGDGSNLTNIGSGSVAAAGSDSQLQYNNSGSFGGASRLYYNDTTNRVGIGTSSPAYDLDVSGSARVQDRLRVGAINSGNGVVYQSSDATINPSGAQIVWSIPGSSAASAFMEYYVFNVTTGTSQRAGTIVLTWNSAGTPLITHTETSTPDIGSTSVITFTSTLSFTGDPQLIATNTSGNTWYMIMNYRYF